VTRLALWLTEEETAQWVDGSLRAEASERMVHIACALRTECVLMLADHTVVSACPGREIIVERVDVEATNAPALRLVRDEADE
jgi:hypothetical protein